MARRERPPVAGWVVVLNDDEPVLVAAQGETPIGVAEGWRVVATLASDASVDTFTVGDLQGRDRGTCAVPLRQGRSTGRACNAADLRRRRAPDRDVRVPGGGP